MASHLQFPIQARTHAGTAVAALGCLAVLAMLSLHGPAVASTDEDWGQCAGKDLDAAIAACSQIMQRRPVEAWKLGNTHNQRGLAYAGKGDYDRAIDDYSRAIYLNAGNAWPYNNRGLAHAHKGNYDHAIADYTKAIELEPESAWPYHNRGLALAKTGDHDSAIADYTKSIEFDADNAWAYNHRGQAYAAKREYDRAIAERSLWTSAACWKAYPPCERDRGINRIAHNGNLRVLQMGQHY